MADSFRCPSCSTVLTVTAPEPDPPARTQVDLMQLLALTGVQTVVSVARHLFSCEQPSRAQRERARRALDALVDAGLAVRHPGRYSKDPVQYRPIASVLA